MFTVALLAQKGGVGKTTLTVTLAVQAELAGHRSGIVDADPQGTASGWYLARKKQGKDTPLLASVTDPARLREAVRDAREDGIEWLFLDTPAGVSELPATAADLADILLLPCVPSVFNMDAMEATVRLAKRLRRSAFFLVNRGRSKGINDECALALTSAYGLPAVNTHITHRLPIADAEQSGSTLPELVGRDPSVERGRDEFRALWQWLEKQKQDAAALAAS
jgi:chromosome partitioning protein